MSYSTWSCSLASVQYSHNKHALNLAMCVIDCCILLYVKPRTRIVANELAQYRRTLQYCRMTVNPPTIVVKFVGNSWVARNLRKCAHNYLRINHEIWCEMPLPLVSFDIYCTLQYSCWTQPTQDTNILVAYRVSTTVFYSRVYAEFHLARDDRNWWLLSAHSLLYCNLR